jgi:hypothetical protein
MSHFVNEGGFYALVILMQRWSDENQLFLVTRLTIKSAPTSIRRYSPITKRARKVLSIKA